MKVTATLQRDGNQAAERVARHVVRQPRDLPELVAGMESPVKRVKNAAAKAVRCVSEVRPELLQSHLKPFVALMSSDDTILRWIAIDVCGNLVRALPDLKLPPGLCKQLSQFLADESMVTASHAVDTLGKLGEGRPRQRAAVTKALADLPTANRSPDCRRILWGRVVLAYGRYASEVSPPQQTVIRSVARRLVRRQSGATKKKAEKLLGELE